MLTSLFREFGVLLILIEDGLLQDHNNKVSYRKTLQWTQRASISASHRAYAKKNPGRDTPHSRDISSFIMCLPQPQHSSVS